MKRLLLTAAAIAVMGAGLAACETATPYQPAPPGQDHTGYGYRDFKIDATHWRVSFAGNSLTSRETVEKYLLYRAAELTVQQGYDWFEPTERHTDRSSSFVGSSPFYDTYGWGWHPYWGYGGPWGWRTWSPWYGGPFWADTIDIQQVSRYEANAEIAMGRTPPPSGQRVFNAREVVANLGPSIERPKP